MFEPRARAKSVNHREVAAVQDVYSYCRSFKTVNRLSGSVSRGFGFERSTRVSTGDDTPTRVGETGSSDDGGDVTVDDDGDFHRGRLRDDRWVHRRATTQKRRGEIGAGELPK